MTRTASLLVVDDNEANRDVLSRRLAQQGLSSSTVAADGDEALALRRRRRLTISSCWTSRCRA